MKHIPKKLACSFLLLLAACVSDPLPEIRDEMENCSGNNCDPLILGGDVSPEEMIDLARQTCRKNRYPHLATESLDPESFQLYADYFRKEKVTSYQQLLLWREMYFLDPEFEVPVARFVPGLGERAHHVRFASKHKVYCIRGSGFDTKARIHAGDGRQKHTMIKEGQWHGHCFVRFRCW